MEKTNNNTTVTPDKELDLNKKVKKGRSFKSRNGKKDRTYRRDGDKDFHGGNDFAFWNEYPELMSIATRIPWMHVAGTQLELPNGGVSLPNVAVQSFYPIPGVQTSPSSPLNLAFRKLYLDMHRKYRGIGTYQASDIAITILCIESALQKIVEAERIYGILNKIPVKSRIQPVGLLRAMGYTGNFIKDVNQHMADFRYGINRLVDLAKRLPLPKGMNFCLNHTALNGFVYADSKDDRADIIVFKCDAFFEYRTVDEDHCVNDAGTAVLVDFNRASFSTYTALLDNIESSLKVLLFDSDILKITSDFIACYGEENMQVLMPLPEDYVITPQYDERILLKWHNSENAPGVPNQYVGVSSNTTTSGNVFCVYQEDDVIISWPSTCSTTNNAWAPIQYKGKSIYVKYSTSQSHVPEMKQHIADTWEEDPGEDTVCEAMLWKFERTPVTATVSGANAYLNIYDDIGTELLGPLVIAKVVNDSPTATVTLSAFIEREGNWNSFGPQLCDLMHFDWHPYRLVTSSSIVFSNLIISKICGDTDNITVVSSDVIYKIHDAALLSAFTVKVSGSKSNS